MSFMSWLINQSAKPSGLAGRIKLWRMGRRHCEVQDWGLSHVSVGKGDVILDVGCGGGKNLSRLAAHATEGEKDGIHY